MIKSMTGFGSASPAEPSRAHTWEVRSVNSRFLDIKWHLPMALRAHEGRWEKIVRAAAARGRLDVTLALAQQPGSAPEARITLDQQTAGAMLDQLAELARKRYLSYEPDLNRLIGLSHLWNAADQESEESFMEDLDQGLRQALEQWNISRELEGANLLADLQERLARLKSWVSSISQRAPEVKEEKFQAMRSRIESIMEKYRLEKDDSRLIQELAVLSDRLDISEEMTRLLSHFEQLEELFAGGGQIGKRLDFLLQECFREINTCGNKAQDSQISRLVIDCKTELEKCREQTQNIE